MNGTSEWKGGTIVLAIHAHSSHFDKLWSSRDISEDVNRVVLSKRPANVICFYFCLETTTSAFFAAIMLLLSCVLFLYFRLSAFTRARCVVTPRRAFFMVPRHESRRKTQRSIYLVYIFKTWNTHGHTQMSTRIPSPLQHCLPSQWNPVESIHAVIVKSAPCKDIRGGQCATRGRRPFATVTRRLALPPPQRPRAKFTTKYKEPARPAFEK